MTDLTILSTLEDIIDHSDKHNLNGEQVIALHNAWDIIYKRVNSPEVCENTEQPEEPESNLDDCVDEMAYNLTLSVVGTLCSKEVHEEVVKMLKAKIREADT